VNTNWGWKEALVSVGIMGPSLLIGTAGALAIGYAIAGAQPEPKHLMVPSQIAAYACWLIGVWLLFRAKGMSAWSELRMQWPSSGTLGYLALGPAIMLAVGLLAPLLRAKDIDVNALRQILADPVARPMLIAFGITIGPLVEEMLFRGILLPVAARSIGIAGALALTSVPFALIHGPQYSWSWQHILLLVFVSVAFGVVRLRSGSTMASTLTHGAYNLMMFAAYFVTTKDPQL
jgi:membrane protease YdiL (CAAX protease family)